MEGNHVHGILYVAAPTLESPHSLNIPQRGWNEGTCARKEWWRQVLRDQISFHRSHFVVLYEWKSWRLLKIEASTESRSYHEPNFSAVFITDSDISEAWAVQCPGWRIIVRSVLRNMARLGLEHVFHRKVSFGRFTLAASKLASFEGMRNQLELLWWFDPNLELKGPVKVNWA